MWLFLFIFGLLFISSFAGFLPVVSWVLIDKSLIINTIHFSDSLRVKLWLLKGNGCFLLGIILTVGSYFSFYFKKKVRNDEKIKTTILLALFHFFCNIKPLNIAEYSQFFCLEKKKNCCAIW